MEEGIDLLNIVARDPGDGSSRIISLNSNEEKALEEHGLLHSLMFMPFRPGIVAAGLLIVEGSDDVAVWREWLDCCGLKAKGVEVMHRGGFPGGLRLALYLQYLNRAGVRSVPFFLLVDSDNDAGARHSEIEAQNLGAANFHVSALKEIESYLIDASALAHVYNADEAAVRSAIGQVTRRGKEGLNAVVAKFSTQGAVDTGVKGLIARRIEGPPADLACVVEYFEATLPGGQI